MITGERMIYRPPPAIRIKSKSRSPAPSLNKSYPAPVLGLGFHHAVDVHPGVSAAAAAPGSPPPPSRIVTIYARFVFWNENRGFGYAKPVDKTQTKVRLLFRMVRALEYNTRLQGGTDVRLTIECGVSAFQPPLHKDDLVQVTIDSRHDRPFLLERKLRRKVQGSEASQ